MEPFSTVLFRTLFLIAGAILGVIVGRRDAPGRQALTPDQNGLRPLDQKPSDQELRLRVEILEKRVMDHESRLNEIPPLAVILSATDEAVAQKMHGLDEKLVAQYRSIEALRTTASQTDELLQRLLESVESLRTMGEQKASAAAV